MISSRKDRGGFPRSPIGFATVAALVGSEFALPFLEEDSGALLLFGLWLAPGVMAGFVVRSLVLLSVPLLAWLAHIAIALSGAAPSHAVFQDPFTPVVLTILAGVEVFTIAAGQGLRALLERWRGTRRPPSNPAAGEQRATQG